MGKWNLIVARERLQKQGLVADSLFKGNPKGSRVCINDPEDPTQRFVACGQLWVVERIVPAAMRRKQQFWLVDNGYYKSSGRGHGHDGHFEFTYRGLEPFMLDEPDYTRFPAEQHLMPWKTKREGYVLLGLPGPTFGKMIGLDMESWMRDIKTRIRKFTDRPIRTREKWSKYPLTPELLGASVVVTHSSNIGVDAVQHGIPAIVAPTNPAAPVCSTTLAHIENPPMPDRRQWWASLMTQQYTVQEMRSGLAWRYMEHIMKQVDGCAAA
jgi:hypothetical protein